MKLEDAVLKVIIEKGPINLYQIAKKLGKKYNSVKYHVLNLVETNTIKAFPSKDSNEVDYKAHPIFDLLDEISGYVQTLIDSSGRNGSGEGSEVSNELFVNMNRMRGFMKRSTTSKIKFNLKKLSTLVINEFIEDSNSKRSSKGHSSLSN